MAKLAFCDYHNMVAILKKTEHNTDFHQIVDFLEAYHIRRITRGTTRISQSKVPLPGADETTFPSGDVRYGEAFPTDTSLDAGQDRENIAKTSAMPHEALPRERIQSQDLEITQLKTGVKNLKDNKKRREGLAQEDALNTMWVDQGENLLDRDKSADKGSDSTDEMSHVLGSLGAANILATGGLRSVFTTASVSVANANIDISFIVVTASRSFPTAVIFSTASVTTPTTRVTRSSRGVFIGSSSSISVSIPSISKKDKGKEKMTEPGQPSKEEVLEQMSIQLARDLEAKFSQEDLIIIEQAKRDVEIAKIYAEKELKIMIAELDRSNEMIEKHLAQINKYQGQQNKQATKTERRNFYMSILRSNAGWKDKDFKRITFEQIEGKFIPVWEKMQDFVPMNSKLESERLKRPGIRLDKEKSKKLKTIEASGTEPSQEQQSEEPKELSEEELKKMMELVPVQELYIKALQVKYPIIDWKIYSKGQRKCWKIIRVENHTEVYQLFEDMIKKFDREDLDKLWSLVKEACSTTKVIDKKQRSFG
nr:hypothetical protein [Tanacetum cinerariifolium]